MMRDGSFRTDLLARLQGFTLQLAPLAQRRAELGLIISTLLQRLAAERAARLRLAAGAARRVFHAEWPLNIRGLQRCLEAALVLCDGDTLQLEHIEASGVLDTVEPDEPDAAPPSKPLSEADAQRSAQLAELLRRHEGNISAVAREMGKTRFQIRRWMTRYGLR
jgi:DNA-binding NtrC family response regulator